MRRDPGHVPPPGRRARVDGHAEVAVAPGLLAGPFAGAWEHAAEQRPGRPEGQPGGQRTQPGRDRAGPYRPGPAGPVPGHFLVAEPAPVGPVLQGVAPPHHPGVEAGHDERPGPGAQAGVVTDPGRVPFPAEVRFGRTFRAQGVRICRGPPQPGVGAYLVQLLQGGREGAAAEPAPQRGNDQRRILQVPAAVRLHRVVQNLYAQVGRDGVESAAVHDARAGARRHVLVAVDALPLEQHLTGQVRVVGAGPGAGLDQGEPARAVRSRRGRHHPRRAGQRRQGFRIAGVGGPQRPARRHLAQPGADLREPRR